MSESSSKRLIDEHCTWSLIARHGTSFIANKMDVFFSAYRKKCNPNIALTDVTRVAMPEHDFNQQNAYHQDSYLHVCIRFNTDTEIMRFFLRKMSQDKWEVRNVKNQKPLDLMRSCQGKKRIQGIMDSVSQANRAAAENK